GATTRGLGQVMADAVAAGCTRILIGLGGSASTDGGAGALAALGWPLTDHTGRAIADGGAALADLAQITPGPWPTGIEVIAVTDVTAGLLGASGAAAVFGPQKGASPRQVDQLDHALAHFADLLGGDPDQPGAGAAG